jgi:hypothetical protein
MDSSVLTLAAETFQLVTEDAGLIPSGALVVTQKEVITFARRQLEQPMVQFQLLCVPINIRLLVGQLSCSVANAVISIISPYLY